MTTLKNRLKKIKEVTLTWPYSIIFLIVLIAYLGVNALVNQTYVTTPTLFSSYKLSFAVPYIALSVFTALLVALCINLAIFKVKEYKLVYGAAGFTLAGIFVGILGGACPGCFVGLFPLFIGLFGISAVLSDLPFFGLEIQVLSILLLMLSVFLLTRDTICKVNYKK